MAELTLVLAMLAGLGSFVAPCILPMIPAFLVYISGTTITDLARDNSPNIRNTDNSKSGIRTIHINRTRIIMNSVFFVLGFSIVFSIVGVFINGILPQHAENLISGLNHVGGIIIMSFGVFLILATRISKLNIERRFFPTKAQAGYPLSFLFGLAFAASWTPCVGPILGTILTLAATTPSIAFNLLLAYSLGLGIPFILIGIFYSKSTKIIRTMSRHLKYYNLVLGSFIITLGILVFTNQLARIASFPLLGDLIFLG